VYPPGMNRTRIKPTKKLIPSRINTPRDQLMPCEINVHWINTPDIKAPGPGVKHPGVNRPRIKPPRDQSPVESIPCGIHFPRIKPPGIKSLGTKPSQINKKMPIYGFIVYKCV